MHDDGAAAAVFLGLGLVGFLLAVIIYTLLVAWLSFVAAIAWYIGKAAYMAMFRPRRRHTIAPAATYAPTYAPHYYAPQPPPMPASYVGPPADFHG